MVKTITSHEFNDILQREKLVLVDFFATWCGPCKRFSPTFEQLAHKYGTKVGFYKVDVDESDDLAKKYDISAMPTFILFKNGKAEAAIEGTNEAKLVEILSRAA